MTNERTREARRSEQRAAPAAEVKATPAPAHPDEPDRNVIPDDQGEARHAETVAREQAARE